MTYDPFKILKSTAVPLPMENVDTDQIIPARFLKATERVGFGENLFRDWRYNQDGSPKDDFILNNKNFSGKILIGGKNFGSGSSREHAVWAIYDYGFRCVVSSFFADIFKNNCLNIGVLPVQVSENFLSQIFKEVYRDSKKILKINLLEELISIEGIEKFERFSITPYKKNNMTNGYDDIDYLVKMEEEIKNFSTKRTF
ncbi:MAG: 3-isopropylmalate dehydratase small subunit [Flavobacteriaceae bacterium TMED184]|nr:MAG: 3-isopropylmalate dehydratase small subunit [Flavobacteriaceae bacterium TMED184]